MRACHAELLSVRLQSCKTEVYDINHLHKADLATSVEKSARLLSTTRGTKDRFKVRGCRSVHHKHGLTAG